MDEKLVKAYIIDDEEDAIKVLRDMLENNFSVSICGTSGSIDSALEELPDISPDILFLDVEMNGTTSLERYTELSQTLLYDTKIVFYTGFDKYMLEAIRRQAFDYIVKPANIHDLSVIMNRYYEHELSSMKKKQSSYSSTPKTILLTNEYNEQFAIRLNDIIFFRFATEPKMWEAICKDGTIRPLRHRTSAELILDFSSSFKQINKRYIVNLNYVESIIENTCVMIGQSDIHPELKISKNFKREFMKSFYNM